MLLACSAWKHEPSAFLTTRLAETCAFNIRAVTNKYVSCFLHLKNALFGRGRSHDNMRCSSFGPPSLLDISHHYSVGALWHPLGCENARNQPILASKIEETINLAVLLSDKKPWSHRGAPWCGFADGTIPQVKDQNLGPEIDRIGQIGSPFHKIQAWLVRTSPIHGDWFTHSLTTKVSTYLDSKSKYQIMGKLLISSN